MCVSNIKYVVSAFRRTVTVRLKPDTTYEVKLPTASNQHLATSNFADHIE
jgi:hypothetical protein